MASAAHTDGGYTKSADRFWAARAVLWPDDTVIAPAVTVHIDAMRHRPCMKPHSAGFIGGWGDENDDTGVQRLEELICGQSLFAAMLALFAYVRRVACPRRPLRRQRQGAGQQHRQDEGQLQGGQHRRSDPPARQGIVGGLQGATNSPSSSTARATASRRRISSIWTATGRLSSSP